jgi:dipeptidyl aminopeptidase/acylaminoacyl peptidase
MEITLWIAAAAAVVVALLLIRWAMGVRFFRLYSQPKRMLLPTNPADYGLEFRDLEFSASDGVVLKGWLILPPGYTPGERRPAVISTHGYSTNRSDIIERSAAVARAGLVVFTFDWRACGESGGNLCSGGLLEQDDLRAAVDCLAAQPEADPERIAVYGFSMGGVLGIINAAEDKRIRAVVADSPFVNMLEMSRHIVRSMFLPPLVFLSSADQRFKKAFGRGMADVDAAAAAPKIAPRPLLVLHGTRDRVVPPRQPRTVFDAAREPKQLEVNPGGGHFDNASPAAIDGVIVPFLKKALKD